MHALYVQVIDALSAVLCVAAASKVLRLYRATQQCMICKSVYIYSLLQLGKQVNMLSIVPSSRGRGN